MRVAKRTFLVSGGSSGLGFAAVLDLLGRGAHVAILDLKPPLANADGVDGPSTPARLLEDERVRFFKTDITKTADIQDAVDASVAWANDVGASLGGVINSAGIGFPRKMLVGKPELEPHPLELWDSIIAVNLTGAFNLTRLVLPHLAKVAPDDKGERGIVIFISSLSAFEGGLGQSAYAASKGALVSLTLPMARDLGPFGIRVNTVAPGGFLTPLTLSMPPKFATNLSRAAIFPQRLGEPAEFAQTIRWLIECGYVNGECIKLWGGTGLSTAPRPRL